MIHLCLDDETIADFVAGALSRERRAEVEESLDTCEDCRALVALVVTSTPASSAAVEAGDAGAAGEATELAEPRAPVDVDPDGIPGDERLRRRFSFERAVGRGAMGTVFRARHLEGGALVAIKLMHGAATDRVRVAREVRLLSELSHPSIVGYVDHGPTDDGRIYLVMEWLEGITLGERLRAGRLTIEETLELGLRVSAGLDEVHRRGIVHRDIKPSNLMLVDGSIDAVKIVDFGIAHEGLDDRRITMTGAVVGTPGYMAPEQARGEYPIGKAADIFALGAVLYHALTALPPFAGSDVLQILIKTVLEDPPRPSTVRGDVPQELDDLVMAMLSKLPAGRPADAARAHEALLAARAQIAVVSQTPRRSLTVGERRLFSVILARAPGRRLAYSAELAEIAARHEGKLEAMVDGSLVVAHGGSTVATDSAARAARCALALKAALPDAAISLATGRGRLDESDNAAVLDRLAKLAPRLDAVGIDDVTAGLLDARFELAARGDGLELRREREAGDEERTLLGRPSPCVGRDRELSMLEAIFEECLDQPAARKVLVTGDPGIGKSRIRRELLRRIDRLGRPVEVWTGRGDPLGAGAPFSLIAPALLRSAGISPGDPVELRRPRLLARVARNLGRAGAGADVPPVTEGARIAAFLGESAGVTFADDRLPALRAARQDPMLMADQIRQAWCDFLLAECAAQPVVILLEDLHWGDRASVQLLCAAVRALEGMPLLLLAFARPEARDRFVEMTARHGAEEVSLRPLARRASEDLVRSVLGEDVARATIDRVVELAQGNAFFLEELIRAVAEGRGDTPPETILGMTEALLSQLDVKTRRLLRAASVFGGVFWTSAVESLLGRRSTRAEIDASLAHLAATEMITPRRGSRVPGADEYRFRHALLREAAYATLTDEDRRDGHAGAAEWLETHLPEDTLVLAEHLDRGGDPRRAARHYLAAASHALDGDDAGAARDLAARALRCAAEGGETDRNLLGQMHGVAAAAHRWRAENAEAEGEALTAISLLPPGSASWFAASSIAAQVSGRLRHADVFDRTQRAVIDTAPLPAASEERMKAIHALLAQHWFAGRVAAWEALLAVAEAESDPASPALAARLHQERARAAIHAGDLGAYVELLRRGVDLAVLAGDVRYASNLELNLVHGLIEVGAADRAEPVLSAMVKPTAAGLDFFVTGALLNLGRVLNALGDFGRARAYQTDAIARCAAHGDRRSEGGARMYLADSLSGLGDLAAAEREALAALDVLGAGSPLRPRARATLAAILLAGGRVAEARAAADEAMAEMSALGWVEEGEALVRLTLAEAMTASGDHAAARATLVAARYRLFERAEKIEDAGYRRLFLERVAENARTLALAAG